MHACVIAGTSYCKTMFTPTAHINKPQTTRDDQGTDATHPLKQKWQITENRISQKLI
jgi:hypothetical protein